MKTNITPVQGIEKKPYRAPKLENHAWVQVTGISLPVGISGADAGEE